MLVSKYCYSFIKRKKISLFRVVSLRQEPCLINIAVRLKSIIIGFVTFR